MKPAGSKRGRKDIPKQKSPNRQRHQSKIKSILSHLIIYKEHIGCTPADLAGVVQADKVNSGVNNPYGSSDAV